MSRQDLREVLAEHCALCQSQFAERAWRESCRNDLQSGSTRHRCYPDNALTKMGEDLRDLDTKAIWRARNFAGRAWPHDSSRLQGILIAPL
jgi:hypothetical protein